jgi:hypothetical protein
MATISPLGEWVAPGLHKTTWTALTSGDVAKAQNTGCLNNHTIAITGTADGGSLSIQSSIGSTSVYGVVDDQNGDAASSLATGVVITVNGAYEHIKPVGTGGTSAQTYTVVMMSSKG